ncbi:alpha-ribazole phosphatase [uncultured Gammaproteobacteria bacterium]
MSRTQTVITRWWWVRHAPVIGAGGKIYGQRDLDADTSDTGRFTTLAAMVPRGALWLVSPLRRTHQTATAIRAAATDLALNPQPRIVPELIEQNFGAWQGLSHAEIDADNRPRTQRFWATPAMSRPPGGESFAELTQRLAPALAEINHTEGGRDIIAVAHGGTIRAALSVALALDPETALRFSIDTLSLTRLDHISVIGHPPVWRVVTVNHSSGRF